MTVLGIDPGFAKLGLAVVHVEETAGVVHAIRLHERATFRTSGNLKPNPRLDAIARELERVIYWSHPDLVGWEDVAAVAAGKESRGAGKSSNGARIREVCGMVRMLARTKGDTPSYCIAPATYRAMVFGKGQSRGRTKAEVRTLVQRRFGVTGLTCDESEATAIAVAAYGKWRAEGAPRYGQFRGKQDGTI